MAGVEHPMPKQRNKKYKIMGSAGPLSLDQIRTAILLCGLQILRLDPDTHSRDKYDSPCNS